MAVNKKSNLLECIFISKKSLEISLNLTSQIKQLSLTHFVLIVTEPNLEARSFYSEYRGILVLLSYVPTKIKERMTSVTLPAGGRTTDIATRRLHNRDNK